MKFLIRRVGYTLFDQKRNEEILEFLKVEPLDLEDTDQIDCDT